MPKTYQQLQAESFNPSRCPACSRVKGNSGTRDEKGVATCVSCGCVFTTRRLYLGDSYAYVLPHLDGRETTPPGSWVPFDLEVLTSEGPRRRHGFFAADTRLLLQVG